jgi:hypothetical protein
MLFKVEIRTDDPELVKILCELRKRAKFVKKALKHYISTKQGKETFRVMSKRGMMLPKIGGKDAKSQRPENFVPTAERHTNTFQREAT